MSFRKYLVLAAIVLFGSFGDTCLSYAMKQVGPLAATDFSRIVGLVFTPWVALGILFLIGFFASYMSALSWADLTYVLPASGMGYVLLALMAQFLLHERVTTTRWIGILLVSLGVTVVTRGPALTTARPEAEDGD